jgi:hypothetical protein
MIPEPSDTFGMWSKVKALSGWPDTDEDRITLLADSWRKSSAVFAQAAELDVSVARRYWRDDTGAMFADKMQKLLDMSDQVDASSKQQQNHAEAFAAIVTRTKTEISDLIEANIQRYGMLQEHPYGPKVIAQQELVSLLAIQVNKIIDAAAAEVLSQDSGVLTQGVQGDADAEYNLIQQFMYDEMVNNSRSATVDSLQFLNDTPTIGGSVSALGMWAEKVKPGGDWDHKSDIIHRTAEDNTFTPIPGIGGGIRYDFWSNLHYGYVGIESGFDANTLHQGADAADYLTQDRTDPADELAVQMGIDLREQYGPGELRPEHLHQAIQENYSELVRVGAIVPD